MKLSGQPLCSALTRSGLPCRNRALRGLDPPRCHAHAPRESAAWNPPRACSATTRRGKPCRAPAIKGSDPPLCCAHAGRAKPLWPPPVRCTARVSDPRRTGHEICRARAIPGSDPPRCAAHAGLTRLPASPAIACTATTKSGAPCRAPAAAGSDPPLCAIHAGHGGFTFENTCARPFTGKYAIVPRRRFWQQWHLAYDTLFGAEEIDLTWQQQVLLCRLATSYFIYITREPDDMPFYEFWRAMHAVQIGIKSIVDLFEAHRPNGRPRRRFSLI